MKVGNLVLSPDHIRPQIENANAAAFAVRIAIAILVAIAIAKNEKWQPTTNKSHFLFGQIFNFQFSNLCATPDFEN